MALSLTHYQYNYCQVSLTLTNLLHSHLIIYYPSIQSMSILRCSTTGCSLTFARRVPEGLFSYLNDGYHCNRTMTTWFLSRCIQTRRIIQSVGLTDRIAHRWPIGKGQSAGFELFGDQSKPADDPYSFNQSKSSKCSDQ